MRDIFLFIFNINFIQNRTTVNMLKCIFGFLEFGQNRDSQMMQGAYARSVMQPVNIPNMDLMPKAAEQRLHCKCNKGVQCTCTSIYHLRFDSQTHHLINDFLVFLLHSCTTTFHSRRINCMQYNTASHAFTRTS